MTDFNPMKRKIVNLFRREAGYLLLLILAITISWCWVHGIRGLEDLHVPSVYAGDGFQVYALIKAYASGEIFPGFFRFISTLNAPWRANWNDFPFEDIPYFPAGILAYVFGLSAGTWLFLLCIQLLAGFSFYFASRTLNLDKSISAACAVLFGLTPFAFYRGVPHLNIAMCWHIPLMLISLLWYMNPTKVELTTRQGWWLGAFTGIFAGLQSPYYWVIFLFLLIIILAGAVYRKEWLHVFRGVTIAATVLVFFLISHAGTLLFWFLHGRGGAFERDLWGLVVYGLRLPDLITPFDSSRFDAYSAIFYTYRRMYPGYLKGEAQSAYVGVVAIAGLLALFVAGTVRLAARAYNRISDLYWVALGIMSFAVVGGINYLLGSFGFVFWKSVV